MFREVREIIRLVGLHQKAVKCRSRIEETPLLDSRASVINFTAPFRFLDLPPEVRARVFEQLFSGACITLHGGDRAKVTLNDSFNLQVLQTCHNVRDEATQILIASTRLNLLDKRPQHLLRPIPTQYLRGVQKVYLLPRVHDHLNLSDFPSLKDLHIFVSREQLFTDPKPSAENYEDIQAYSDADLIADAWGGLLRTRRYPEWLVSQLKKSKAERGYNITVCCTIWHKRVGSHLDLEIKLDGEELDMVIRRVQTWTSSSEHDDFFM